MHSCQAQASCHVLTQIYLLLFSCRQLPLSSSVCQALSQIVVFAAQSYVAVLSSYHKCCCHALCSSHTINAYQVKVMLQYKTVERVLADRPTVVMMAHINPLKDIVTAIRAAKIIVEEYKVAGMSLCWFSLYMSVMLAGLDSNLLKVVSAQTQSHIDVVQ